MPEAVRTSAHLKAASTVETAAEDTMVKQLRILGFLAALFSHGRSQSINPSRYRKAARNRRYGVTQYPYGLRQGRLP